MARSALTPIAIVAVVLTGCTDSVDSVDSFPDPTPASPADTAADDAPESLTSRPLVDPWIAARVAPNVVGADDWFEVTPSATVAPICGVRMTFYTPVPQGQGELIGALLLNDEWQPHEPGVTTTLPPCVPPSVSDAVGGRVPAELAAALHEVCLSGVTQGEGCGLLRVVRPGQIDVDSAGASAEPTTVAPGDEFVVEPADDALVCNRHELLVRVDGELDLVGFPTRSGVVALPVPGATTTVPTCGAVAGYPSEPISFVTPDVPDGEYLFCLAFRTDRGSCARIEVLR